MKIIASFDDGSIEDFRLAELMLKYEVETIFYWPVERYMVNQSARRQALPADMAHHIANYFEIGSHTLSHPNLTRISNDQVVEEVVQSRTILQDTFNQKIKSFCYPKGYANDYVKGIVAAAGYETARNVGIGNVLADANVDPLWQTPSVHVAGSNRKEYAKMPWKTHALKMFKRAKQLDESGEGEVVYHLWGHSWEISRFKQWKAFEDLLQEITEK